MGGTDRPTRRGTFKGGGMCRSVVIYLRMASVPARRPWRTNPFITACADMTTRRCGLLPNLIGHLLLLLPVRSPNSIRRCLDQSGSDFEILKFSPYKGGMWPRHFATFSAFVGRVMLEYRLKFVGFTQGVLELWGFSIQRTSSPTFQ